MNSSGTFATHDDTSASGAPWTAIVNAVRTRTCLVIVRGVGPAPALGVAVTVICEYASEGGASGAAVRVSVVVVAVPVTGLGLNTALMPGGRPDTVNDTSPLDALSRFSSTGMLTDVPARTLATPCPGLSVMFGAPGPSGDTIVRSSKAIDFPAEPLTASATISK